MTDYSKMKNADLEGLLKDRGLTHSGKKAELIKRLQDDDAQKSDTAAPASTVKDVAQEDEIDWDDEPATTTTTTTAPTTAAAATTDASQATTEPAAAAIAAGGQGQPPNPQAVPNQQAAIDPATTDDLSVSAPAPEPATTTSEPQAAEPVAASTEAVPAEERAKTPVDFSAGIAKTTLEQEIEKRKARAKKFGIDESTDDTLKELERAKRFGGTDLPGRLNEALPEKREKKRARDTPDDSAAGSRKKGRPAPGARRDSERRNPGKPAAAASKPTPKGTNAKGAPAKTAAPKAAAPKVSQMSEADKAKAEARKARFASAT